MHFKRSFTEPVPKRREEGLATAGIAAFHGRARFVGPNAVQVGEEVLEGRYVVIATGQEPADLKIPGREHLTTSDQFLELDELPKRILFIGGGYIAFEFAHVAVRAGAQVTVVHRGQRPLPPFDPDLVDQVVESTRGLGVDVQLGTEVVGVEKSSGRLMVRAAAPGEQRTFETDMVVHAAGRVPEIGDLNLDAGGVKGNERGVAVNEFLQSVSNPAVYAAGDAAASGGPPLTPVAGYEGMIVAANLLKGNHQKPNYLGIPTVVFTIPPLAAVGLVYFALDPQAPVFRRDDLLVRVGAKEEADPIPVCYCLGFTRKDIENEIAETGRSSVAERISAEVKQGSCACEVKNPSGKCRLGNIRRIVRGCLREI